jgi:hypothetical protein
MAAGTDSLLAEIQPQLVVNSANVSHPRRLVCRSSCRLASGGSILACVRAGRTSVEPWETADVKYVTVWTAVHHQSLHVKLLRRHKHTLHNALLHVVDFAKAGLKHVGRVCMFTSMQCTESRTVPSARV